MIGTVARLRSNSNHTRINRRNVDWPSSVSATGRVSGTSATSALHQSEMHVRGVESAAFRHHAQNPVTHSSAVAAQKLVHHDQNGCRTGVTARIEIREPTILGNARATHVEQIGDLSAEVMR